MGLRFSSISWLESQGNGLLDSHCDSPATVPVVPAVQELLDQVSIFLKQLLIRFDGAVWSVVSITHFFLIVRPIPFESGWVGCEVVSIVDGQPIYYSYYTNWGSNYAIQVAGIMVASTVL